MNKIILASQSPRRKELLELVGYSCKVCPTDVDESLLDGISLEQSLESLAMKKAMPLLEHYSKDIIIGADTVVVLDDVVLGKPVDKEEAYKMLSLLSNRTHQVITAVALLHQERKETFHVVSHVTFYALSKKEIENYLSHDEYKDKAGSYAIQGRGAIFVKEIHGDYHSIVGLPIASLIRRIEIFKGSET